MLYDLQIEYDSFTPIEVSLDNGTNWLDPVVLEALAAGDYSIWLKDISDYILKFNTTITQPQIEYIYINRNINTLNLNPVVTPSIINDFKYMLSLAVSNYGAKFANELKTQGRWNLRDKEIKFRLLLKYLDIVFDYLEQYEYVYEYYDIITSVSSDIITNIIFNKANDTYINSQTSYVTYSRTQSDVDDIYAINVYKDIRKEELLVSGSYVHVGRNPAITTRTITCIDNQSLGLLMDVSLKLNGAPGVTFPYTTYETQFQYSRSNESIQVVNSFFTYDEFKSIVKHINSILKTNFWINLN